VGGKGGRCIGLTTLSSSCDDCPEIWESQPPGILRACRGIALPFLPLVPNYEYTGNLLANVKVGTHEDKSPRVPNRRV
jgi:hypothetical protein